MTSYKSFASFFLVAIILFFSVISEAYGKSKKSSIEIFGDYAQVINPLVAASIASQEKGVGHFMIIFAQSNLFTHAIKYTTGGAKCSASKRPSNNKNKIRYDGMPSGHTNSAWLAASYIRMFSEDNKKLSIPLYITAAITGYSRVNAKKHTVPQVVAGAALAEITTYINSRLDWSNEYISSQFNLGTEGAFINFQIKF